MRVCAFSSGTVTTVLLLALAGCRIAPNGEPARTVEAAPAQRFTAYVRIEGVVQGGAIKLNGSQVSLFPGWVTVEVDDSGKAVRQYVVNLSTNILGGDLGQFVIEQGGEVPLKIFYERTGPVPTGTARIERPVQK